MIQNTMESDFNVRKAHYLLDIHTSFKQEKYKSRPEKYLSLKEKGLIEEYEWFEDFKVNDEYEL